MPNPKQVCSDDDQFINSYNEVAEGIYKARVNLLSNHITICVDCGEAIPKERKIAIPSTKRCIACQEIYDTL